MKKFKGAFWPLLLVLSTLVSCGTIKSKKNIIFADSSPRGLEVENEKGEMLGKTPFFFQVRPGDKRKFNFYENGKVVSQETYRCRWDWGGSIVPNLLWAPIIPVGTALSTIFVFGDATTKGLYVCKGSVFTKIDKKVETNGANRVVIGMPIAIGRSDLAEKAIHFWKKNIFEKNKTSETFLWDEKIENEFIYRGVDLYINTKPSKIKKRYMNQIAHKFKGTHFIHFDLKEDKEHFIITPMLYDAFTLRGEKADFLKTFKMKKEKATAKNYWKKILRSIDFFPSALTLSLHTKPKESRVVSIDPGQTGEFTTDTHPEAFPKFFTLFGVESVRHPQLFSSWDWGGFLSPSFGASSWRTSYLLNGRQYNFDFESYNFGYDASLTGFSPLGQLSAGIGFVGSLFQMSDNLGYETSKLGIMTRIFISYTKFFNDRIYFTTGFKSYKPSQSVTGRAEYALDSWSESYLGLGYYFPEVKALARKLIGL